MANHDIQYPITQQTSMGFLARSFFYVALAIVVIAANWFFMVTENQQLVYEIIEEQEESKAVFTMREAAYQRTIALSRMLLMEDEFDQDEEYLKFKEQAGKYIQAREKFVNNLNKKRFPQEFSIWNELVPNVNEVQHWQSLTIDLLQNGERAQAHDTLLNKAMPEQDIVMAKLTKLLEVQRSHIESTVEETSQQNDTGIFVIGILATLATLWCLGVGIYTIKRAARAEQSLENAKLKAQDSDKHKSQFLANMSHEIRTPLTAIIGFSEALIEEEKVYERKTQLNSIVRNGKHLHQLVNDILDLSKVEANELSIEKIPVSVSQILEEVESLMESRAQNKGLHFESFGKSSIPKQITSDPTRLKQVLINICGNAIKFTAKGRVTLKTRYEKESNKIYFDIEDSGIGLNQIQLDGLFKPFKQADVSTTRIFGGTGLGLCISKQLAEKMGGGISVDSLQGVGSRFTVHIDAGKISQSELNDSKEKPLTTRAPLHRIENIPALKGRILLAEDNLDNQRLISMYIKKTGAEVEIVSNGKQALESATKQPFDLILMDMQMPVMDGIEAISNLRKANCTTPIAMLTANAMRKDARTSEIAGANDFLSKPIDKRAFYAALTKYLSPSSSVQDTSPANPSRNIDLDDISDLIETYVSRLPETIHLIEQHLLAREWDELKDEIHQLKGTGGAFGFPEITTQCTVIEENILGKDLVAVSQSITSLSSIFFNIRNAKAS